jgi:1-acyl-sn-glycerol-3-phosphate acyltransferase
MILMVPVTIFLSGLVILAGALHKEKLVNLVMRTWAKMLLWVFGIKVIVEGDQCFPPSGGGVIAFNHQSHFDIPVLLVATSQTVRFGAKIELFRIPIFASAMRAVGTLPIAREKRSEAVKIYEEAKSRFQQGIFFALAPEGTRQESDEIGPFKKGPFYFAIQAGVPVIPAVIRGAHAVMPKHQFHVNVGKLSRTIHIRFLHSQPPGGSIELLRESVHHAMKESFRSLNA